jgi:long-chain acyl-CoA synthetase
VKAGTKEWPWFNDWPKDVPRTIDYPELPLARILSNAAKSHPDNVAIYYSDEKITFRELHTLANRFGKTLQDQGIEKGDRVAIYLPNIPQFVVAYYGALDVGAVVVAISSIYKERELLHILADSSARVLVCWDKLLPYVRNVRSRAKLESVITCNLNEPLLHDSKATNEQKTQGEVGMNALLANANGPRKTVEIQPKRDLALLQYSGGTSGTPKGAMLTHYNLVVNAIQFSSWLRLRSGSEVHLAVLPFFHIYGMTVAMNVPIYTSSAMILIPDARDSDAILRAIDQHKPTIFCGVPAMYMALINRQDVGKNELNSIRVCVSGASPLPLQVQRRFEELTGGRLVEGYGLTETSPVTHVNPIDRLEKNRPGSIGLPISDTEARIVDLDTGSTDLPPGSTGELVIRGPQVMLGYWNNPEETRKVLRDSWIYTGDIASMDFDGYFRIVDRKTDMINVSGLKVWPREVEEVLYEHPAVKEVAAVAVPDSTNGEVVKVFVTLKDGFDGKVSASEIIEFCKARIADYKAPRIVDFRGTLPKSSVGKILRRQLRENANENEK